MFIKKKYQLFSFLFLFIFTIAGSAQQSGSTINNEHRWNSRGPAFREIEPNGPGKTNKGWVSYENFRKDHTPVKQKKTPKKKNKYSSGKKDTHKRKRSKKTYLYYKMKHGDTLYRLSRKYNVSIKTLCRINRIKNRNNIARNTIIKIPQKTSKNKYVQNHKQPKTKHKKTARTKKRQSGSPSFRWPVSRIVSFKKDGSNGVKAIGIIITGKHGSPVLSSATGIVKKVSYMRGYGHYVIVEHPNRYITVYSKLGAIFVKNGQKIKKGDRIGLLSNKNRLHFQIGYAGKPKNPLTLLPKKS